MNIKKIMAAVAIASGFTALGLGVGTADAVPVSTVASVTAWPLDPGWDCHGHGHGHGHDGCDWGGPWYGPGGYGPGWYGPGISGCVSATGPWVYVTGSVCF